MKKYCIVSLIIIVLCPLQILSAQSNRNSFFNKNGTVSQQNKALKYLADTIEVVNPREDDVVWSKIVYRVIDMRDKQNFQLYFPVQANSEYRNLMKLILDAMVSDSLPVKAYDKEFKGIIPLYSKPLSKEEIRQKFVAARLDTIDKKVIKNSLFDTNPLTQKDTIVNRELVDFTKSQLKFVIQEIVFFDKHSSRLYSKIIGIAPFSISNEVSLNFELSNTKLNAWETMYSSVICWFLFDELRPYLAKQYVIPNGNSTQRLTYDDFFGQHLYSSYILGDNNSRGWMLLQYLSDHEKIKKEQNRIETEMLNFEQDLWEY